MALIGVCALTATLALKRDPWEAKVKLRTRLSYANLIEIYHTPIYLSVYVIAGFLVGLSETICFKA